MNGSTDALSLKSGSILTVRHCLKFFVFFFLILDNALGHPEFYEINNKFIKVVYLPPMQSLILPLDQGVIKTFKVITHGTLWERLSVLWKKTLTEYMNVCKDYTIEMPSLLQKKL